MANVRLLTLVLVLISFSSQGAALDASKINKASSFVTSGGEDRSFKRVPQKEFWIGDRIYFLTMVTWEPVGSSAGRHKVMWRWYSKDKLISEIEQKFLFKPTPFEMQATIPASALGLGEHKVDLLIDGKPYDTQSFLVQENKPDDT